jgi:hypothetical protein
MFAIRIRTPQSVSWNQVAEIFQREREDKTCRDRKSE